MTLNERLDDLLTWEHEQTRRWAANLDDAGRNAVGRSDAWAARDLLVHFAEWDAVLRGRLAAAVEGRELEPLPPDDEINQRFFERNRGLSWDETMSKANAARAALVAQVRAMPEEVLAASAQPDQMSRGARIVFSTSYHTLRHLSDNLMARSDRAAADALMAEGVERMATIDDSPQFRGAVVYNLACHYAIGGDPDKAVDTLREALAIAPDMAEYAGQDVDFASLRDDSRFQALVVS